MSALLLAGLALAAEPASRPLFTATDKRIIVARYAECVVKRHPAEAVSYVDRLGQAPSAAEAKALSDGKCLSVRQGAYPTNLRLRGYSAALALADALVRSGRVAPGAGASASVVSAAVDGAEPSGELLGIGQCLIGRHSDATRQLLRSEVGSDGETRALAAVQPALADCGAGKLPAFANPSQVRGWAAVAFYRRGTTPVAPGVAA